MIKDLASGKSFQLGLTLFSACISMSTCWFFIVQWPANSLASKCRSASESCAEDVQSQHKKKSSQSWMRQGDTDRYSLIGTSSFVQIVLSFCLFASTTWWHGIWVDLASILCSRIGELWADKPLSSATFQPVRAHTAQVSDVSRLLRISISFLQSSHWISAGQLIVARLRYSDYSSEMFWGQRGTTDCDPSTGLEQSEGISSAELLVAWKASDDGGSEQLANAQKAHSCYSLLQSHCSAWDPVWK